MNTYRIKKIDAGKAIPWETVQPAEISCYPWDNSGYRPKAEAKVCYDKNTLHILLKAQEEEPRATFEKMNDPVCRDSCLEFFTIPDPKSDTRYMNFEFNPLGTMLLGLGSDRKGRTLLDEEVLRLLGIKAFKTEEGDTSQWGIEFHIPSHYIAKIYAGFELKSGKVMKANFYKCGDLTKQPHYGCWNPITCEKPDFHRPEFFGTLILE